MPKHFDYIIIGGGLAGLQLALEMGRDRFFEQRSIAIIDPEPKNTNDKTWCFWEQGETQWDDLITKKWDAGLFYSANEKLQLDLEPYSYKMLRSLDFYEHVRSKLSHSPYIHFIQDEIKEIDKASTVAYGATEAYSTLHIFDSRLPSDYLEDPGSNTIFQHFKGWMVETTTPVFDPSVFTMMDFRIKFKDSTSFTYVLPLSPTKALVEFTFFTPFLTEDAIYDEHLSKYMKEILKTDDYSITETEKGIIPMTDYDFHKHSSPKITKIGTAGSWVKGSTGYSFKHTEKKVAQIIENIKQGKNPDEGLIIPRFRKYDAIFLDVLKRNNEMGEKIFTKFYRNNSPQEIFKYLDEETTFKEELKIMFSLFHPQFLVSFFRKIF
ncbi:lycopene cyclase [Antarcticibacterium flavum]|uniref:Lycopene cyclase n=1 Tax=Antarcticibacterium flavum TaxID=2058175 RepID=A0A5B7X741_9FLAO|nr:MULTISPECIES: lycopene cyclase family protein [Antarcticibacterium]MCM4159952.1 lycopene cyclase [Antarcticibacterium sp. W02-3]QCY70453.1 lycopene cyclase [Antarcticibacterium flavum]